MVAAAGDDGTAVEQHHATIVTNDEAAHEDLQDGEQATLATLAMLAAACNHGNHSGPGQQGTEDASAGGTAPGDAQQGSVKRSGSSAGLLTPHHNKHQRLQAGDQSRSNPDSPMSATAAAAAAAGLHKLSSASAAEFEGALGSYEDGMQHMVEDPVAAVAGMAAVAGGSSLDARSTPAQIMQQLVDCGILPSCRPDTHCFVKCGMVQGVFSLESGSIICLCDECSETNGGEPTWFAPAAFERHGGMAASKKWRGSIQVKGLSSRKTLGQWLDERGVTAKPRLTLADQVQQAGGSGRQRVGPAISGRGPGTGSDLAAAAANAARLAGLGKPTAAIARSRALTLAPTLPALQPGMETVIGFDAHTAAFAALPQYDAVSASSVGLPQLEALAQAPAYLSAAAVMAPQLPLLPTEQPALVTSSQSPASFQDKLQRLLTDLASASSAPKVQEVDPSQQQSLTRLLQQPQELQLEPQQLQTAPPPASVPSCAATTAAEDSLAKLACLLPGIMPVSDASRQDPVSTAVSVMAAASTPPPATIALQVPQDVVTSRCSQSPDAQQPQATVASQPVEVSAAAPVPNSSAPTDHPTNLLLTLATAKAMTDPMGAFDLLSQALQQQLQRPDDSCRQAADAAAAAVAAASDRVTGKNGKEADVSAMAAFAAIASAAAAAAAAVASRCTQMTEQQPEQRHAVLQVSPQTEQQHQQQAAVPPPAQQAAVPLPAAAATEPAATHPTAATEPAATESTAAAAATMALQDLLTARGLPASVAQLVARALSDQQAGHKPPQQGGSGELYGAVFNVLLREGGDTATTAAAQ